MGKRRRWLLLGGAARGAAQFADTRVFELSSSSKTNMLADAVVRDEAAGCLESPGISRRYGDRCVAQEADAVETERLAKEAAEKRAVKEQMRRDKEAKVPLRFLNDFPMMLSDGKLHGV